jgi:hypothetical protein
VYKYVCVCVCVCGVHSSTSVVSVDVLIVNVYHRVSTLNVTTMGSRRSSVSVVTRLRAGRPGFNSQQGQ